MTNAAKTTRRGERDVSVSIEEVVVERKRDDKPDYVRVKYTDMKSNKVVGHTRVLILVD